MTPWRSTSFRSAKHPLVANAIASSSRSPGLLSPDFRIPRLQTGSHILSPGVHPTPVARTTLATPRQSPGRIAVDTDAQSVGGDAPFVPAPLLWGAIDVLPPRRDGPLVPQAGPAGSSEMASRPLSLLLPPRLGGSTYGTTNSVWTGDRATQGGAGPAVGPVKETSNRFAPHRVSAFAATGGGAAASEPLQVSGIRPRTAREIEVRATRAEKKRRRRKPQAWHCDT